MNRRNTLKGALAASILLMGASPIAAETRYLTMDGFPASTGAGQIGIAFSQAVQKDVDAEIQISVGKAGPKMAIDAAQGKVDLIGLFPTINFLMAKQLAMFAQVDAAPELAKNLRSIFAYPVGLYHILVYEESGIETLGDLAGKKVFLGPPGGAATNTMVQVIEAATGLKPEEDYELMRFDWKSAETAFLDRQMDIYAGPNPVPGAIVQQFALSSPIRLLSLTDEQLATEGMKNVLGLPGRTIETIPVEAYDNLVNEEGAQTIGTWGGIGTHKGLDADIVYEMTKAFWNNIADVHATAEWMQTITLDAAFRELNAPLHPGAIRYYREAGMEIPEALIPPEAR